MNLNALSEQEILNAILKIESENKDLRTQLKAYKEPIAVVGMACQFPGAHNIEEFWCNLINGKSSISEIPKDRWELNKNLKDLLEESEINACKWGGFIDKAYDFNPSFFSILDQEALSIDPQHRLFLQTVYHALEHAGIPLEAISHQNAGVYAAMMSDDYGTCSRNVSGSHLIDMDDLIGNEKSFISGRVSHWLKIKGPSLVFSTACSSSLVAVHYAKTDLQNKSCDIAIVGGVNLMLTPYWHVAESKLTALSGNGKCSAFSKNANGYVRGEGCGVIILKRLDDALKSKSNILAVIEGSAVNHTGEALSLTSPNPASQAEVIQKALENANVSAEDVAYIETHGSGTVLGDSIELLAIKSSYCQKKRSAPIILGAVKTNIGHLEAASGIAGLIKAVLTVHQKQIVKNLNISSENSLLEADKDLLEIPYETLKFKDEKAINVAVSSFGLSGTNAHIILSNRHNENQNKIEDEQKGAEKQYVILISAHEQAELYLQLDAILLHLNKNPSERLCDLAYTLSCRHSHFNYRKAFVTSSIEDLKIQLRNFHQDKCQVYKKDIINDVIFLFPGFGEQSINIATKLYENNQIFRGKINECQKIVKKYCDVDILKWVKESPQSNQAEGIDFAALIGRASTRPAKESVNLVEQHVVLFVIEYAMFTLLNSLGIKPTKCLGYSLGELAAWACSEIIPFEELLKIVIERAILIEKTPDGGMIVVSVESRKIEPLLRGIGKSLCISAELSDNLFVVSGIKPELETLKEQLNQEAMFFTDIAINYAIHSFLQAQNNDPLANLINSLKRKKPQVPLLSNVTGQWLTTNDLQNDDYLGEHLCSKVQLNNCIRHLISEKAVYFEVGPGSSLLNLVHEQLRTNKIENFSLFPTLSHRFQTMNDENVLLKSLGQYWQEGGEVDWEKLFGNDERFIQELPQYHFITKIYKNEERVNWEIPQNLVHHEAAPNGMLESFYRSIWVKANMVLEKKPHDEASIILIHDKSELSNYITSTLSTFQEMEENKEIEQATVICCLSTTSLFSLQENYKKAFNLVKRLNNKSDDKFKLVFVVNNHYSVVANEGHMGGNLLEGIIQTLSLETPHIDSYIIDIDLQRPLNSTNFLDMIASLDNQHFGHGERKIFAIRNDVLWRECIIEQPLCQKNNNSDEIYNNKTLIISGGFGAIGREISKELAKNKNLDIILLTRAMNSSKHEFIKELEKSGGRVKYIEIDISSLNAETSLDFALSTFQHNHQYIIFHCAGMPDNSILEMKSNINEEVINAKVESFDNLVKFCNLRSVECLINFSSSITHFSMPGQCDYISANCFLNNVAQNQYVIKNNTRIHTIAWSFWKYDSWQSELLVNNKTLLDKFEALRNAFGMNTRRACEIIEKVIQANLPFLIVLPDRKEQYYKMINQIYDTQFKKEKIDEIDNSFSKSDHLDNLFDILKSIWEKIFCCKIDNNSDFFQLGGNSLVAMRLLGELKKTIPKIKISIKDIFVHRTVNALYEKIAANIDDKQESLQIKQIDESDDCLLSYNQEEMWITHMFHPIKHLFNEAIGYKITGGLNISIFNEAIRLVIEKHSAFKTSFLNNKLTVKQTLLNKINFNLEIESIQNNEEFNTRVYEFIENQFNLTDAPLFKVKIYERSEMEHYVIFLFHHIIIDGYSYKIFVNELNNYYNNLMKNLSISFEKRNAYTYFDYANWQKKITEAKGYQNVLTQVKEKFSKVQPTTIEYDYPQELGKKFKASSIKITIDDNLFRDLKKTAQDTGTSLFSILYSAFSLLLFSIQNQDYVMVGSVSANRNQESFNNVIGYFVNTIPLYSDYKPDISIRTTIVNNFYNILDTIENAVVPFGKMLKDAKVNNPMLSQLFSRILFLVHEDLKEPLALNDLEIREINIADRSSRADLVFEFESSSQNISGELIYNCSLYKAQTCNRLIAGLIKSLELLVKSCGKKQNEFIESLKNEDVFEELKRV